MTGNDEMTSAKAIGICRSLNRKLAAQCNAKGISGEDIALASLYSAFDIAEAAKGPGVVAIEWLRTGLDVIERQVMAGEQPR